LLGAILCAGFALRVIGLSSVPPGMWSDEALNGIDAWKVWHGGGVQLVYPDVFPREPMFVTLLALAVKIGGAKIFVLRAVSVLLGTLTILALYLTLRREEGEATALASAGVLATMHWHALMSRLIFRTIALPLWITLLVWATLAYRRRPTWGRAALFGALVGGGFYTYLAWYFMLPLALGLVVWLGKSAECSRWPDREERLASAECGMRNAESGKSAVSGGNVARLAVMLLTAAVVLAPLGVDYARHPDHLLARAGAVSVFSEEGGGLREIAQNAGEALLMFHWKGDHVAQQNVPWSPALDRLQGIALLWGLVVCVAAVRRRRAVPSIVLAWLGCGLLPTIFTVTDSPNFLRTLVAAPAVAAIAGIGLADLGQRLAAKTGTRWACGFVVLMVVVSGLWAGIRLRQWGALPEVRGKYQAEVVRMGGEASIAADEQTAVFIPRMFEPSLPLRFQLLEARNVHFYDDWGVLGPWEDVRVSADAPPPERRLIFYPTGSRLLEGIRTLAPGAGVIDPLAGEPPPRLIGGAVIVPESGLPPAETVRRVNAMARRAADEPEP
jgi:hypothetical protein